MDGKIRRTQSKLESVTDDRGDLRKFNTTKEGTETYTKELSERGDTAQKSKPNAAKKSIYVTNDPKSSVKPDKDEDARKEQLIRKKAIDKTEKIENQIKTYLDLEGRRRLRERYTVKLNVQKDLVKNEKEKISDKDEKKSVAGSITSEKRKVTPKRRPIIKTITIKNNNRVYKAVTFVDQKNHTPLEIKIPPISPKKKVSKSTETNIRYGPTAAPSTPSITAPTAPSTTAPSTATPSIATPSMAVPSKVTIREKLTKKDRRRKRVLSPDIFRGNQENRSPVTEVAKWVPSSLNEHTQPYYEAWVNTTLSAISRCTEADKEEIFQALKAQQYGRTGTPELFYENFNDERYTGRIKIITRPVRIKKENKR